MKLVCLYRKVHGMNHVNGMKVHVHNFGPFWCTRNQIVSKKLGQWHFSLNFHWNVTLKELKVALEKIRDNIPQVQLTTLSQVLEIVWQDYMKGDRRHSGHFSRLKAVYAW